jgi:hypothetical protein
LAARVEKVVAVEEARKAQAGGEAERCRVALAALAVETAQAVEGVVEIQVVELTV